MCTVPRERSTRGPRWTARSCGWTCVPHPYFPDADPTRFFAIVRAGFSQKRKQLLNSLSGGLGLDKTQARAALDAAGIDPRRRAQTLSLDEWGALYTRPRVTAAIPPAI
ncbi:MAG: hypothetical protein R2838_05555 [Caldilineaceae bacterium]